MDNGSIMKMTQGKHCRKELSDQNRCIFLSLQLVKFCAVKYVGFRKK